MFFGFLAFLNFAKSHENGGNVLKLFGVTEGTENGIYLFVMSLYLLNVTVSYPMAFVSMRDSVLGLIYKDGYTIKQRLIVSECLFVFILCLGCLPMTIDNIVRWKGALFAPNVIFTIPAILLYKLVPPEERTKKQNILMWSFGIFGIFCFIMCSIYCFFQTIGVKLK